MRLLIVDDSALMRRCLRECFEAEGDFEIAAARDGRDALERIAEFDPDVVTLDINMPVMDGLTCLAHIMTDAPRPVVMVSSLTDKGALATFEALELGAVDYVAKPGGTVSLNLREVFPDIVAKVRAAAAARRRSAIDRVRAGRERARLEAAEVRRKPRPVGPVTAGAGADLVMIGVSTGGPRTLEDVLAALPADFPAPLLVAQHMPARFTSVFAERLDAHCALAVSELAAATPLEPGCAYIARGDADVLVSRRAGRLVGLSAPLDARFTWHPSVARMVASAAAAVAPERLIAVMLTGMGDDGAAEMTELRRAGGRTVAEAEETAVIFGMPKELIDRDGATRVAPAPRIPAVLTDWIARPATER
jgi:two-component system chemotaxis response regulator CheB